MNNNNNDDDDDIVTFALSRIGEGVFVDTKREVISKFQKDLWRTYLENIGNNQTEGAMLFDSIICVYGYIYIYIYIYI